MKVGDRSLKIFARKWRGGGKGGGGLWVWGGPRKNGGGTFFLEIEGVHIIFKYFLKIPYDAAYEKNLDVFIFPLLINMC